MISRKPQKLHNHKSSCTRYIQSYPALMSNTPMAKCQKRNKTGKTVMITDPPLTSFTTLWKMENGEGLKAYILLFGRVKLQFSRMKCSSIQVSSVQFRYEMCSDCDTALWLVETVQCAVFVNCDCDCWAVLYSVWRCNSIFCHYSNYYCHYECHYDLVLWQWQFHTIPLTSNLTVTVTVSCYV